MMYQLIPQYYQSQEINRLTLAYFVVSGLDILGAVDRNQDNSMGFKVLDPLNFLPTRMGYIIQAILQIFACASLVGQATSSISSFRSLLLRHSLTFQDKPDGCFLPVHIGAETDLRFIYCAAAICFMLGDWSGMDKEKAKEYILNCQCGFGMVPSSESHVASLRLMGLIEDDVLLKS